MLRISKALYDEVIAHCRNKYPKEACGILAGPVSAYADRAGQAGIIEQVYPMTNVEDSPIGYSMDPKEQLLVEKRMRARHQQLVGVYHSHTATEAYPSSVDVGLAISPEISYVLVSLKRQDHPELKSYRIEGPTVTPEQAFIEAGPSGRTPIAMK